MDNKDKKVAKQAEDARKKLEDDFLDMLRLQETSFKNLRVKVDQLDEEMQGLLAEEGEEGEESEAEDDV